MPNWGYFYLKWEKNAEISRAHQGKSDIGAANICLVLHRNKAGKWASIQVVCMNVCVYVCGWGFMHTEMDLTQVVTPTVKHYLFFSGLKVLLILSELYLGPISMWIWVHKALKLCKKKCPIGPVGEAIINHSVLIYCLIAVSWRYCVYII